MLSVIVLRLAGWSQLPSRFASLGESHPPVLPPLPEDASHIPCQLAAAAAQPLLLICVVPKLVAMLIVELAYPSRSPSLSAADLAF